MLKIKMSEIIDQIFKLNLQDKFFNLIVKYCKTKKYSIEKISVEFSDFEKIENELSSIELSKLFDQMIENYEIRKKFVSMMIEKISRDDFIDKKMGHSFLLIDNEIIRNLFNIKGYSFGTERIYYSYDKSVDVNFSRFIGKNDDYGIDFILEFYFWKNPKFLFCRSVALLSIIPSETKILSEIDISNFQKKYNLKEIESIDLIINSDMMGLSSITNIVYSENLHPLSCIYPKLYRKHFPFESKYEGDDYKF